jgi:hypothetical protein
MSKKKDNNQNALKHGAYSRKDMLPEEKFRDYEALREAHYDEWAPEGVTEQCLVDDLCKLRWRKRRMDQYDQIHLRQRHAQVRQRNYVNRHRNNLKNWGVKFSEAASVEVVEEILSGLSPFYVETITGWVPREKYEDPAQWGQEIGKFLSNLEVKDQLEGPDMFAAIVNPDLIETEISRSDRLDEAIDRKIKRLMQVKTAKQVFPNMRKNARPEPRLINAPASADRQPAVISENEPKPAKHAEIVVSAKSDVEKGAFTAKSGAVIEGIRIDEGGPVSIPPDVTEKEHSDIERVKVEFFAKPVPPTVDELVDDLEGFCALCNSMSQSGSYSKGIMPAAKQ